MAKICTGAGKATVQRVYAVLEDVPGELQAPDAGGYITPAGRASMSQTPTYSNSEELSDSLNVIEQFQDAVPVGSGSISLFGNLDENYGKPEGDALFQALMGDFNDPAKITCSVAEAVLADANEIPVKDIANANLIDGNILAGKLPPCGVVKIGAEKILYREIKKEADKTVLARCKRGYGNTQKADIEADAHVQMLSRIYSQSVCRPTLSIYMLNDDKLCLFMSGCSVTQMTARLQRQNGQMFTFDFQGRRMGWCGVGELAEDCASANVKLIKGGASAFTPGGYVRNSTLGEMESGYKITGVDDYNDVLTLASAPQGWKAGHVIKPWMPKAQNSWKVVESRFANVEVANVAGKMLDGSLSIQTPVSFLEEIGDEYIGEGVDSKRTITLERTITLRQKDCVEFGRGYKGYELPVSCLAGKEPGLTLRFHMPRVKFGTPELGESDSFLTLKQNGAALGVEGEDALFIIQE